MAHRRTALVIEPPESSVSAANEIKFSASVPNHCAGSMLRQSAARSDSSGIEK